MDGTAHRRAAVALAVGAAIAVLGLRAYVAEPVGVPTASMAPTLLPGDHLLVDKLAYRFGEPRRRDVVVLRRPGSGELLVKRVVAVGGDRIGIADGVLRVNGRAVREPFVDRALVDSVYFGPVRVPAGAVFVLGDRRWDSVDSRTFGPVADDRLLGRVDLRLWPPSRAGEL